MQEFFQSLTALHLVEYLASGASILGAEKLSRGSDSAAWGWMFWLVANVLFIAFAIVTKQWGILVMQMWFMKTSVFGIKNHLLPLLLARK